MEPRNESRINNGRINNGTNKKNRCGKEKLFKIGSYIRKMVVCPCTISYHTYVTLAFLLLSLFLFIGMMVVVFLLQVDDNVIQIIYIVTILASTGILTTIGSLVNKLKKEKESADSFIFEEIV